MWGGERRKFLRRFYDASVAKLVLDSADVIIGVTQNEINHLLPQLSDGQARVKIIPNGIHLEEFKSSPDPQKFLKYANLPESKSIILYVGRLSVEKGVDTLLAACELLMTRNIDYSLTVVGDGPRSKELSDLAKQIGIADRVRFVGSVPREDLGAYYRATDILCVPSLDEPFGNVVLEGLLSGCLVVGSELGGIRFIISDGIDGYLVPPAKPLKWAEKLIFISENREELNSLVKNGRDMVGKRFDWKNIVLDMHEAISRTIA